MTRPTVEKSASSGEGRRCVLLIGVGAPIPVPLLERMQRREAAPVVVASPAAAMTALAEAPTHALIVQAPATIGRFDELQHAVAAYHPGVVLWAYEPGEVNGGHGGDAAGPRLVRVSRRSRPRSGGDGSPSGGPGSARAAAASTAAVPRGKDPALPGNVVPDQDDVPLVTAEELRMLLGPIHAADQGDAHAEGR